MKRYYGTISCKFDILADSQEELYAYIEESVEKDDISIKLIDVTEEETIDDMDMIADQINDQRRDEQICV